MISLFGWLLVFHILASIAVIGPAFVVPFRTVLIITGVWLMIITKMGLSQMWLNISILLSLLMVATIEGLIGPRMKKIIPIETASQLLMIAITVLMVLKPF